MKSEGKHNLVHNDDLQENYSAFKKTDNNEKLDFSTIPCA